MSEPQTLVHVDLMAILRMVGVNPDKELNPSELAHIKGLSRRTIALRIEHNPVFAKAWYLVGKSDLRTTLRRIWAVEDEMARMRVEAAKRK